MNITITPDDWRAAREKTEHAGVDLCENCVIAQALKAQGYRNVAVGVTLVTMNDNNGKRVYGTLTPAAQAIVEQFTTFQPAPSEAIQIEVMEEGRYITIA